MNTSVKRGRGAFSLIEVSLAIFVVAMGLLTVFSLFPAGLRQVQSAHESTQEALFADYVLSTLRGEALQITGAGAWTNIAVFRTAVVADIVGEPPVQHSAQIQNIKFPPNADPILYMRYLLELNDAGDGLRSASLWCKSGEFGATDIAIFKRGAAKFYTDFFYSGMP